MCALLSCELPTGIEPRTYLAVREEMLPNKKWLDRVLSLLIDPGNLRDERLQASLHGGRAACIFSEEDLMKDILYALGAVWLTLWLVNCASPVSSKTDQRVLIGDRTGTVYFEHDGVVQNSRTGAIGFRRGNWVQDAKTGKLEFIYGGIVEEERIK